VEYQKKVVKRQKPKRILALPLPQERLSTS
jgi:hypothetical protein